MKQSLIAPPGTQPRKAMQLNRTCACGTHTGGGECGHCRSQRDTSRHAIVPRGGGMRLPSDTRHRMEAGFGESFDDVRLHTGAAANRSAQQVNARAFTVGTDVVLSDRASAGNDALIAHELAHVVQQRHASAPARLAVGAPHSPVEGEARAAAANVAMGHQAGALSAAPAQLVQREEETSEPEADVDPDATVSLGAVDHPRVDQVMSHLLGQAGWHMLREVMRGFVGATSEAAGSGRIAGIAKHLAQIQLSPWQMAKFGAGYMWGAVQGLLSPVIDLVKLLKSGVSLLYNGCMFVVEKAMDAFLYPDEMAARAGKIMDRLTDVGAAAFEGIAAFIANPREGIKQLGAMMDVLAAAALKKARGIGRSAAEGLMGIAELPPFALGEKIGYIVGMVAVQILMLIFTQAIGNALSAAGRALAQGTQFVASKMTAMVRAAIGVARSMLQAVKAMGGSLMKFFKKAGDALGRLFDDVLDFFGSLLPNIKPSAAPVEGNVFMMAGNKGSRYKPRGKRTSTATTADLYPPKHVKPAQPAKSAPQPKPPAPKPTGPPKGEEVWSDLNKELSMDAPGKGTPGVEGAIKDAEALGLKPEGFAGEAKVVDPKNLTGLPRKADAAFHRHGHASDTRAVQKASGKKVQSAHVGPTSALRDVDDYSRYLADAILLEKKTHRAFDKYWKDWAHRLKKTQKECTVLELRKVMIEAIEQTPDLSVRMKAAMRVQLDFELFHTLNLDLGSKIRVPFTK